MAGLYSDDFVERLRTGAATLVGEWNLSPRTEVRLLNISENATFRAGTYYEGQSFHVRSNGVIGYRMLRFVAALKRIRRRSYRFQHEQAGIEDWLTFDFHQTSQCPILTLWFVTSFDRFYCGQGRAVHESKCQQWQNSSKHFPTHWHQFAAECLFAWMFVQSKFVLFLKHS